MILVSMSEQIFTLYSLQLFLVIAKNGDFHKIGLTPYFIIHFHGNLHPKPSIVRGKTPVDGTFQPRIWQIPATWLPSAAATMSSGEPRRNPRRGSQNTVFWLVMIADDWWFANVFVIFVALLKLETLSMDDRWGLAYLVDMEACNHFSMFRGFQPRQWRGRMHPRSNSMMRTQSSGPSCRTTWRIPGATGIPLFWRRTKTPQFGCVRAWGAPSYPPNCHWTPWIWKIIIIRMIIPVLRHTIFVCPLQIWMLAAFGFAS